MCSSFYARARGVAVPTLVLLRHGQSTWNLENRFTGWWDVNLTPLGEALAAGHVSCAAALLTAGADVSAPMAHRLPRSHSA